MIQQRQFIDLNCDLGEGIGNERELMPLISSCNLACGGHAGDSETINSVIALATKYNVEVGAHPSFPDRENFGRTVIKISFDELKNSLLKQIDLVKESCHRFNIKLHHIKFHGALYNLSASNEDYAQFITRLIEEYYPEIPIYVPFNSAISNLANGRVKLIYEGFADRNYEKDGSLVSRSKNDAVLTDLNRIFEHVFGMVNRNEIKTISDTILNVNIDTICVHGDTPKAVQILKDLNHNLLNSGIEIKAVK